MSERPERRAKAYHNRPFLDGKDARALRILAEQRQIAEMEQRFRQTIAMARANNDPTRVPPQGPAATMKRAHLDIID